MKTSDIINFSVWEDYIESGGKCFYFFRISPPIPSVDDKEMAAAIILIKDMYIHRGITEKTDIATLKPEDYPTFSDFYEMVDGLYLDREQVRRYPMITADMLRGLLLLFKDVYDGSLRFLFNGHTNVVNYNLLNFDVSELL